MHASAATGADATGRREILCSRIASGKGVAAA
jgi:hypothetical protein